MSYKVTLVAQDGTSTEVMVNPADVSVHYKENRLHVCVAWCKYDLVDDPEGHIAVFGAWPERDRLLLANRDGDEVFQGLVSGVGYKCDKVFVEAIGDSAPGPDDMVVTIAEDESDPMAVVVTVDNKGHGPVSVNFGDGTASIDNDGAGTPLPYTYGTPGTWTVTATDKNEPSRFRSKMVTVPAGS